MPSFWTSETPLVEIQAQISIDIQTADHDRTISVPSAAYAVLQQSLARRRALQERSPNRIDITDDILYASVKANRGDRTACVARIIRDSTLDSAWPSDRGSYRCRASRAAWLAIAKGEGGSEASKAMDAYSKSDEDEGVSIVATIELIIPVTLSEIVFGVASDRYADAIDAHDTIADHIRSQTQLYYQGFRTVVGSGADTSGRQDAEASISLTCLMCQPVIQGIICKGDNPRIVITKLPTNTPSVAGEPPDDERQDAYEDTDNDQWDLGVEWFILGDIPLGSSRDKVAGAAFNDLMLVDKADAL
ncbi:hypothetical protein GGI22_005752, partial [Coemansia erecta]